MTLWAVTGIMNTAEYFPVSTSFNLLHKNTTDKGDTGLASGIDDAEYITQNRPQKHRTSSFAIDVKRRPIIRNEKAIRLHLRKHSRIYEHPYL